MTDVSPNLFVGNPLCDKCLGHHPMNWDCQADKPSLIPTPVSPETMTPREIAQEIVKRWGEQQRTPGQSPDLAGLIAEALAAEREACAKIADSFDRGGFTLSNDDIMARRIAQAIRTGRSEGTP
jgi:hypothetical protein